MNEDILCEAPGPAGMTCTMPYGHGGSKHRFEVALPPNVAQLIEHHIEQLDRATEQMRRQRRFYSRWKYAWMGLFSVYLILTLWRAFVPA